jgi:hypothetical protein
LLRLAAVVSVPAAIVLVLVAVDVLRTPGELESNDVRFEAAPLRQKGLWEDISFFPGGPGKSLLEVQDDLAYRRALALFVRVEPGRNEFLFGPEAENLRGKAQLELTRWSAEDANPQRRSRLLNLLAAMSLERYSSDATESQDVLRRAVHMFRSAVEVDPANADAKLNLELALRTAKAVNLPGTDPDAGPAEGSISGQGRSGSGY